MASITEAILTIHKANPDWTSSEISEAVRTSRKYVTHTLNRLGFRPAAEQYSDPVKAFNARHIPEPNSGCWLWEGSLSTTGYGRMTIGQKQIQAHRFSYQIHKGKIPHKMEVLHRCDNPPCVNPEHLRVGTHQDNMRDMYFKGRKGLLTPEQAAEIRESGRKIAAIARDYGVSVSTIKKVRTAGYYKREGWNV